MRHALVAALAASLLTLGCDRLPKLSLSKGKDAIPLDGPRLGALSEATPVFAAPDEAAQMIGYLHAGGQVPRAERPAKGKGCEGGWYQVWPRGFVCTGKRATLDLSHPTLVAMALRPELGRSLPYAYARTTRKTSLFERDQEHPGRVLSARDLRPQSGLALVGSWTAEDPTGQSRRLAMTTAGKFVAVEDVRRAEVPDFTGVELSRQALPVAFVIARKARRWALKGEQAEQETPLRYHEVVELSGRVELAGDDEYWGTPVGDHVRGRDIRVAAPREDYPEWATDDQRWIDLDVRRGTLVLYEGHEAVFATLVSVGEDPKTWKLGEHTVVEKHVTLPTRDPGTPALAFDIFDAPWVMRLSSGQLMYGAYWHQRFGRADTGGAIELSPGDAAHVWRWVAPVVPDGWHGVVSRGEGEKAVKVLVHE